MAGQAGGARWALGAMSGTSLDGVDAALIRTDGREILEFGDSAYRSYTRDERAILATALGRWSGPEVETATVVVETAHAELLSRFPQADIIGFHGQTLAHDPGARRTLQIGDGQVLAEVLRRPVVWDFRTVDVQLGGQGAPLASFYHHALARYLKLTVPVAFLNIGGVANLTWVDPNVGAPEAPGACLAFDTGPGNARINDLMQSRRGLPMDEGGTLAATGDVDEAILGTMITSSSYLTKFPPKSLDRNDFANFATLVQELSDADAVATLTAATAATVACGMDHLPRPPERIFVTGGGRHNAVLMAMLDGILPCDVVTVDSAGLDGDMLEAQAFGFLAVRVLEGLPTSAPSTTGVPTPVGGGQVSRPRL